MSTAQQMNTQQGATAGRSKGATQQQQQRGAADRGPDAEAQQICNRIAAGLKDGSMEKLREAFTDNWEMDERARFPKQQAGIKGLAELMKVFKTAFPDIEWTIRPLLRVEGNLFCRFQFTGTHKGDFLGVKATGRNVRVWGVAWEDLCDGKVKFSRVIFDRMNMMQQLGAMPLPEGAQSQELRREFVQPPAIDASMDGSQTMRLNREFIDILNNRQFDRVRSYLSDDWKMDPLCLFPGQKQGVEGFEWLLNVFVNAFPDAKWQVEDEFACGNTVVTRFTFTGTQKGEFLGVQPTDKRVKIWGLCFDTLGADGKFAYTMHLPDAFGMMQQLGAAPSL